MAGIQPGTRINRPMEWNGAQDDQPFGVAYGGNRRYADGWERTFGDRREKEGDDHVSDDVVN